MGGGWGGKKRLYWFSLPGANVIRQERGSQKRQNQKDAVTRKI